MSRVFTEADHPRGADGRFVAKPAPARDTSGVAALRLLASTPPTPPRAEVPAAPAAKHVASGQRRVDIRRVPTLGRFHRLPGVSDTVVNAPQIAWVVGQGADTGAITFDLAGKAAGKPVTASCTIDFRHDPPAVSIADERLAWAADRISETAAYAAAGRCSLCGEFTGRSFHRCAPADEVGRKLSRYGGDELTYQVDGWGKLPDPAVVRRDLIGGGGKPLTLIVDVGDDFQVLTIHPDGGVGIGARGNGSEIVAFGDSAVPADIQDAFNRWGRLAAEPTEARRAASIVETSAGGSEPAVGAAGGIWVPRWVRDNNLLAPDPARGWREFREVYDEAVARRAAGIHPVDLRPGATGGFLTPETGRGFGVEIEYELGDVDWETAADIRLKIARALYQAGLSEDADWHGYHESDPASGWRVEDDSTVCGEVISPVLHDTPDTWRDIATVCAIIRRYGGRADPSCGSHISVGTKGLDDPGRLASVVKTVIAAEDIVYRLGTDPATGHHRCSLGSGFCIPNTDPGPVYCGYTTDENAIHRLLASTSHNSAVNLNNVGMGDTSRVEFRFPDASLDPAIIQAQVALCAAIAESAASGDTPDTTGAPRLGHHLGRYTNPEEDSAAFRAFLGRHVADPGSRRQLTQLFAITEWQAEYHPGSRTPRR